MNPRTFLSLSLKPWFFSLGTHLLFFLVLIFFGRTHVLDLTSIDLDSLPSPKISIGLNQPPPDEEWQNPQMINKPVPPIPKAQPKPEPAAAGPVGPPSPTGEEGTGTYKSIAQVGQLPRFINQVKPEFPESAKLADITGVVILQVDIDATGAVKKVGLIQGLGYGCDEAAIQALTQSTFAPGYDGGLPVPVKGLTVRYRFKWND